MATLQEAIDQLVDAVGTLTGIRTAPGEPPGKIAAWPAIITHVENGTFKHSPIGVMTGTHTVIMDLLLPHKDTSRDVSALMGYAKSIPNAIYAAQQDGALTALEEIGEIGYEFGPMSYADQDCMGFRFRIRNVKTQDSIT
jgi:hypothetical protein